MQSRPGGNSAENSEGDAIRVFIRVRPPEKPDGIVDFGQCLEVQPPDTIILQSKPKPRTFTFDHVADTDVTQEAVFTAVGRKTIESCVAGYNGTIFAYGQTGSGKTFTMLGPSDEGDNFHHELRGVIPRSFEYLFTLINRERERHGDRFEFLCRCSFLEIYNEQIFDLMDTTSPNLHLRENMKKGVFVAGLTEQPVSSALDAYNVLSAGWINRRVAATSMNRESSRSHAVFTVSIETKEKKASVSKVKVSQLHLVDLAGSERQKDTKTEGVRLKEAGNINKSLSNLGNVIMALVDVAHGKKRHIPYRDSKLSFLLRDALGGNSKTYIIANVHPGAKCFGETLSTLNFAKQAKMIKNKAIVNENTEGNVIHLQAEIKRLREELETFRRNPQEMIIDIPSNEQDKRWRQNFFEAMMLREVASKEKKELSQRIGRLEQLLRKKEGHIQSNKMVIRLRTSEIERLKQGMILEQNEEVASLKQEIVELRKQVELNPTLGMYAMQNANLREEIERLKALKVVRNGASYNTEVQTRLEKAFMDLRDTVKDHTLVDVSTPKANDPEAFTGSLQRFQDQIQKLQKELDESKLERAEQKEVSKKKQIEMEADLESSKTLTMDLQKALEGFKVKMRLEQDARNDMTMQAIKTMVTPKKMAYNLRSRLVLRPSMTPLTPDRGDDAEGSQGDNNTPLGIIEEDVPDHVFQQCSEALVIEMHKLQEMNTELQNQLGNSEKDIMTLTETVSKLEYQLQQTCQLHKEVKAQWEEKEKKMMEELQETRSEYRTLKESHAISTSEAEDFKIMCASADKQVDDLKRTVFNKDSEGQKVIEGLEMTIMKLEKELTGKEREIEQSSLENNQLQEAFSTLQAEMDFKEQQQNELEMRLKQEQDTIRQLQVEKLTVEEQMEMGQMELSTVHSQLQNTIMEKDNELKRLESAKTHLEQELTNSKNDIEMVLKNLQEAKKMLGTKDEELVNTQVDLREAQQQVESLTSEVAKLEEVHNALAIERSAMDRTYQEKIEGLEDAVAQSESEVNYLRAEVDIQAGVHKSDVEIAKKMQAQKDHLEKELHIKETELQDLHAKLEQAKLEAYNVVEVSLDNSVKFEEERRREEELDKVKDENRKLQNLLDDFENIRERKSDEIVELKAKLKNLEAASLERVELLQANQELQTLAQNREEELQSKEQVLENVMTTTESLKAAKEKVERELEGLKATHEILADDFEGMKEDNQRMQNTYSKNCEELDVAKSEKDSLMEEKKKLEAEFKLLKVEYTKIEEDLIALGGHHNPHQRIKLLEKTKNDYHMVKEKFEQSRREVGYLKERMCQDCKESCSAKNFDENRHRNGSKRERHASKRKESDDFCQDETLPPLKQLKENIGPV